MSSQQNFRNHTRIHPLYHLALLPILLANLGITIYFAFHTGLPRLGPGVDHAVAAVYFQAYSRPSVLFVHLWAIVMALALILLAFIARAYALKNQDRLIRLEERLRLATLLPHTETAESHILTTRQFVAFRFAPDAELPALARRAAAESLTPAQIKQSILHWRSDHDRI